MTWLGSIVAFSIGGAFGFLLTYGGFVWLDTWRPSKVEKAKRVLAEFERAHNSPEEIRQRSDKVWAWMKEQEDKR